MSTLPPKADIALCQQHVRFVSKGFLGVVEIKFEFGSVVWNLMAQRGGSSDLQGAKDAYTDATKQRRLDNVQYKKDRTFRGNHPQHRLSGSDRSQRWIYQGAGG
jgi:hypothetical protein